MLVSCGASRRHFIHKAGVAQLVEQLIRNEKVGSSILSTGTTTLIALYHAPFPLLPAHAQGSSG